MEDTQIVAKREWNPEAQLEELMLEVKFDDGNAQASVARRLRQHAMTAAESIAHLAAYANNERVRLQAASYIVDRVLTDKLGHDLELQQEMIAMVGQALNGVVRQLGLRYDFDPDSTEVRTIAFEAMMALAGTDTEPNVA